MASGSVKVTTSIAISATNDSGVTLNAVVTCDATRKVVTFTFDTLPIQTLDVSQAGESVTYSLSLTGNIISGTFVQSNPTGTLSFSITANGSTAVSGNF